MGCPCHSAGSRTVLTRPRTATRAQLTTIRILSLKYIICISALRVSLSLSLSLSLSRCVCVCLRCAPVRMNVLCTAVINNQTPREECGVSERRAPPTAPLAPPGAAVSTHSCHWCPCGGATVCLTAGRGSRADSRPQKHDSPRATGRSQLWFGFSPR